MGDFITPNKVWAGELTPADLTSARLNVVGHLEGLLEGRGSRLRVKQILDIIYEETSVKDFSRLVSMLMKDSPDDKRDFSQTEINLIEASWNIFPHKSLDGKCPLELVQAPKERKRHRETK